MTTLHSIVQLGDTWSSGIVFTLHCIPYYCQCLLLSFLIPVIAYFYHYDKFASWKEVYIYTTHWSKEWGVLSFKESASQPCVIWRCSWCSNSSDIWTITCNLFLNTYEGWSMNWITSVDLESTVTLYFLYTIKNWVPKFLYTMFKDISS